MSGGIERSNAVQAVDQKPRKIRIEKIGIFVVLALHPHRPPKSDTTFFTLLENGSRILIMNKYYNGGSWYIYTHIYY